MLRTSINVKYALNDGCPACYQESVHNNKFDCFFPRRSSMPFLLTLVQTGDRQIQEGPFSNWWKRAEETKDQTCFAPNGFCVLFLKKEQMGLWQCQLGPLHLEILFVCCGQWTPGGLLVIGKMKLSQGRMSLVVNRPVLLQIFVGSCPPFPNLRVLGVLQHLPGFSSLFTWEEDLELSFASAYFIHWDAGN
uniref:Uncharacterized protein n=1 Tax=Micrurus lemniscatus lemniscatus TaxID=129467 RepID=A0A2D4JB01_MICLE